VTEPSLPAPLTPVDCDLRDFPFIPLEIQRLRRSKAWLRCKRNPALAFYLINLWTAAWHDVPAASLEDDDEVLADLAVCDPSKWDKVREDVLRGWIKCSDGRLYHPVVAEKVLEAWKAKQAQRARTEAARAAKEARRAAELSKQQQASSQNSVGTPGSTDRNMSASPTDSVTESVTDIVTDSKREGQGQREGERQGEGDSVNPTVPNGTDAKASPGLSAHDAIFQIGLPWLVSHAGKDVKESNLRSMLGGSEKHLTPDGAWQLVQDCMNAKPLEPVAWLAAAINERKKVATGAPARRNGAPTQAELDDTNARAKAILFGPEVASGQG